MNLRLFFVILTFAVTVSVAFAREADPKALKFIEKMCDLKNPNISIDDKMDCVTDYNNCIIVGAGETDLSKADAKCLQRKTKERLDEQFQDSSGY